MKKIMTLCFISLCHWISYSQIDINLSLDQGRNIEKLTGFNTGFNHRHMVVQKVQNGKKIYTSDIIPAVSEAFRMLRNPVMRFPGGVIANFYHLYPKGFNCNQEDICEEYFAKGYGLRKNELTTSPLNPTSEWKFENDHTIEDNWIVAFANLIDQHQKQTGDTVDIVFMINVLSNFHFNDRPELFNGNTPDTENPEFQRNLQEVRHALRYLVEVRHLHVVAVELGTELYFNNWSKYHMVTVDKFIPLIPIYRGLLDNLGYEHIKLGIPVYHKHSIEPEEDNWTRKLLDSSYNPYQIYDGCIIHEYYKMVESCSELRCSKCTKWVDDECSLYTGAVNGPFGITNCEPQKHSPNSERLEKVFRNKINRFAPYFNDSIANKYHALLSSYKKLSGREDVTIWLTEWNHSLDKGCDKWKGINSSLPIPFCMQ